MYFFGRYGLVTEQKKGAYKYFVDLGDRMEVAGVRTVYLDEVRLTFPPQHSSRPLRILRSHILKHRTNKPRSRNRKWCTGCRWALQPLTRMMRKVKALGLVLGRAWYLLARGWVFVSGMVYGQVC